jgi:hypothetical protein
MHHGSVYFIRNRGPPFTVQPNQKGKAKPCLPRILPDN